MNTVNYVPDLREYSHEPKHRSRNETTPETQPMKSSSPVSANRIAVLLTGNVCLKWGIMKAGLLVFLL